MSSVNDWTARAAREIVDNVSENVQWRNRRLVKPTEERIAAIIVLHAEPLLKLLQETRRECVPACAAYGNYQPPYEDCTCGADAWNAQIDEALR